MLDVPQVRVYSTYMGTRLNWIVSIHDIGDGDGEPFETGPYSQRRAREIADAFNRTHDALGWYASAYPLWQYTIPELRAMHEPNVIAA